MKGIHYSAIGVFIAGLAAYVGTLASWHQAITPLGASAILLQIGGFVTALISPSATSSTAPSVSPRP